jgi:hypothetical protein
MKTKSHPLSPKHGRPLPLSRYQRFNRQLRPFGLALASWPRISQPRGCHRFFGNGSGTQHDYSASAARPRIAKQKNPLLLVSQDSGNV